MNSSCYILNDNVKPDVQFNCKKCNKQLKKNFVYCYTCNLKNNETKKMCPLCNKNKCDTKWNECYNCSKKVLTDDDLLDSQ